MEPTFHWEQGPLCQMMDLFGSALPYGWSFEEGSEWRHYLERAARLVPDERETWAWTGSDSPQIGCCSLSCHCRKAVSWSLFW